MKRLLISLILILIALGVLLWRLPASLIASALPANIARQLTLHQVNGTVWNGSLQFSTPHIPATLAQRWQCRPALSPLGLQCTLDGALNGQLKLAALAQAAQLDALHGEWPLHVQAGAFGQASASSLRLDFNSLLLSASKLQLNGHIVAQHSQYQQGSQQQTLGDVTLECKTADERSSHCQLSNRGAEAVLNGTLRLQPQQINGNIELRPQNGATPVTMNF